jgi:hypothetical protein
LFWERSIVSERSDMTENQEEELFKTLGTLVTGVNQIQGDVRDMKETLNEHSQKLDLLVARTDSIAGTVMDHETRLRTLEESGGKIQ